MLICKKSLQLRVAWINFSPRIPGHRWVALMGVLSAVCWGLHARVSDQRSSEVCYEGSGAQEVRPGRGFRVF